MVNWEAVTMYALCAMTCAVNIITLRRAQAVEDRIKAMLEGHREPGNWIDYHRAGDAD